MKTCSKCKETKAFTEFYKSTRDKDGLTSYCKLCKYQNTKNWVNNHRSIKLELDKKWKYKIAGVYAIFENGVCLYIGESKRVLDRFTNHKNGIKNLRGKHKELYISLSQHKNVIFGVLEETPNHKEREQYWIDKLKPKYNGKKIQ